MKRKLILIFCILFLCITISSAGIVDKLKAVIARKNVADACTSFEANINETNDGDFNLRNSTGSYYVGYTFRDGASNREICKVDFRFTDFGDVGTRGLQFRMCICDRDDGDTNHIEDNGDGFVPADDCQQCSGWVVGNDDWANTVVTFTFSPAYSYTQGDYHHFVLDTNDVVDADDYAEVEYDTAATLTYHLNLYTWDDVGEDTNAIGSWEFLTDMKGE